MLRSTSCLFFIAFIYPSPKRRGKARDFFTKIQRTNKVITFSVLKAHSNHTLGQSILLVATPQVKPPVNNPEGTGLNSDLQQRWDRSTSVGSPHTSYEPGTVEHPVSPAFGKWQRTGCSKYQFGLHGEFKASLDCNWSLVRAGLSAWNYFTIIIGTLLVLLLLLLIHFYVYKCVACKYICVHMHSWCLQMTEEGTGT